MAPHSARALSIRAHLHVFSLAVLFPLWAVLGFAAWTHVQQSRQEAEGQAVLLAANLAADLDRELSGLGGLLSALATSPALEERDFERFRRQALRVVARNEAIVVRDRSGQQLFNTLQPPGVKLPVTAASAVLEADRCVFATGRICASGLYTGTTDRQPYVLLDAPVTRDGEVVMAIGVGIRARHLADRLAEAPLPDGWTAAIVDGRDRIIARSREHDQFVGASASADTIRNTTGFHGSYEATSLEGVPVRSAFVRLPKWEWRVTVAVPRSALGAPLRWSALLLGGSGLLGAGLSVLIALFYGRRLAGAVMALSGMAAELDNPAATPLRTPVREVNDVAIRLAAATDELRLSLAERDAAHARLERLNQDLEDRVQAEVAARHDAQARAAQAERVQALGQLAGGMAHDFNNVLQVVTGSAATIEARAAEPAVVQRFARLILSASARGASITQRLLVFARRSDLQAEPLPVEALLAGLEELLAHTLGPLVTVRRATVRDLAVLADRGQLETVLVNLATNARDAMPEGGTLTFSAAAETVAAGTTHPAGLTEGTYVRLDVTDTGTGMDAATLARASEPFFTTKGLGKGSGLGLAMARGFAEQSGGRMWIESRAGQGTTVSLWLPSAGLTAGTDAAPRQSQGDWSGANGLSVLLVEDEDLVRDVLAAQLEDVGCAVTVSGGAAEALALLDRGLRIDALVTDLGMPGMNGLELIRAVRERGLTCAALLITGNADVAEFPARDAAALGYRLVRKPASAADLVERLAELRAERLAGAG